MIYIDLTPPPAIVCQLTDEQQAAAYRDHIRQEGANWARDQQQRARDQAQAASAQGAVTTGNIDATSRPPQGPQGEARPKPRPAVTNALHR